MSRDRVPPPRNVSATFPNRLPLIDGSDRAAPMMNQNRKWLQESLTYRAHRRGRAEVLRWPLMRSYPRSSRSVCRWISNDTRAASSSVGWLGPVGIDTGRNNENEQQADRRRPFESSPSIRSQDVIVVRHPETKCTMNSTTATTNRPGFPSSWSNLFSSVVMLSLDRTAHPVHRAHEPGCSSRSLGEQRIS